MQNFYSVIVQTDGGTRVARFDRFADAMAAYENARLNGAISAAVDRIQHTSHGIRSYRLAELVWKARCLLGWERTKKGPPDPPIPSSCRMRQYRQVQRTLASRPECES